MAILLYTAVAMAQLLYPLDRALPTARLFGEPVGGKTHTELAAIVTHQFQATKLELVAGKKKETVTLASAGADVLTEKAVLQTETYPIWQRYIPLSFLWQPVQVETAELYFAEPVLAKFSEKHSAEFTTAPVNARLSIEKGKLVAVNDTAGVKVTKDGLMKSLREARLTLGTKNTLKLPSSKVPPATVAADFAVVKTQAEEALSREVALTADGEVFTPSISERTSWLVIGEDKAKQPILSFDEVKFNTYLNSIDSKVGKPAGYTEVTITNGWESGRIPGATGRAVTREPVVKQVQEWMLNGIGEQQVTLALHDVAPMVRYNKRYTSSQAGLQAYINDAAARMNVQIAIQQLDGGKWHANVRSTESWPSASTYKLYVAKWLFTQMDEGKVHWNDPILDTNVTTCFDRMTIASTNPCAVEWLARAGRDNVNNFVWGLGFSRGTSFTTSDANHTTANDLLKYMTGLNNGSLVGGAYRDRLLHNLSVHPYRYGIPTGSAGRVEDKVGFLWDYVHDAAIVHHPRGTYVMAIMTKGQSYATIANLTREVERIMYP